MNLLQRLEVTLCICILAPITGLQGDDPSLLVRQSDAGGLELIFEGILQTSEDLTVWTDLQPQPASPWYLDYTRLPRFFELEHFQNPNPQTLATCPGPTL